MEDSFADSTSVFLGDDVPVFEEGTAAEGSDTNNQGIMVVAVIILLLLGMVGFVFFLLSAGKYEGDEKTKVAGDGGDVTGSDSTDRVLAVPVVYGSGRSKVIPVPRAPQATPIPPVASATPVPRAPRVTPVPRAPRVTPVPRAPRVTSVPRAPRVTPAPPVSVPRPRTAPAVLTPAPPTPSPPHTQTQKPTGVPPTVSTRSSSATPTPTTPTTPRRTPPTTTRTTPSTPSTSPWPKLRELLCTVGHAAISNNMYPPEGICTYLFYTDVVIVDSKIVPSRERNSWKMFKMKAKSYKAVKSGIAFDHRYIRPNLISQAMGELTMLAGNNIASYGLLNIIGKPDELHQTVLATKPVMEALKNIQGSDTGKRTVIAIGSYDYSGSGFMAQYKDIFAEIIDTFKADIVIAISSVGSIEDKASCYAAPPNVLISPKSRFPSLQSHWPLVRSNTTYANGEPLVGLSFEMGTMIYILEKDATSLNNSAYAKCLDVGMTTRDAVCGVKSSIDKAQQLLKDPYMIYATFLDDDTKRHVAFAEYFTSTREKYNKAVRKFGTLHHRSALMLFNVHLGDVRKKCGTDAFGLIKWICQDFKGQTDCG